MLNNMDLTRLTYSQMRAADNDYQTLYPDIYYQLQPYVIEACDQMECCGATTPSREMLDMMGERIVRQLGYAEAAAVSAGSLEAELSVLRSRGLMRDLLDILLLQELFGRRRRYYY